MQQRNRFYNAHAYIEAGKSNWNRVFTQAYSGEGRAPLTLQRTGTKPCGCGSFQVLALLCVIVFAQIPTLIEKELPITNMTNVSIIYWKPVSTWVVYISYRTTAGTPISSIQCMCSFKIFFVHVTKKRYYCATKLVHWRQYISCSELGFSPWCWNLINDSFLM